MIQLVLHQHQTRGYCCCSPLVHGRRTALQDIKGYTYTASQIHVEIDNLIRRAKPL